MKLTNLFVISSLVALGACGPDNAVEERGDQLEEKADAVDLAYEDRLSLLKRQPTTPRPTHARMH